MELRGSARPLGPVIWNGRLRAFEEVRRILGTMTASAQSTSPSESVVTLLPPKSASTKPPPATLTKPPVADAELVTFDDLDEGD